jgi:hypothetical protein
MDHDLQGRGQATLRTRFPMLGPYRAEMAPRRLYTAEASWRRRSWQKKIAALLPLDRGWRGRGRDGEGAAQAVCAAAHCSCGSAGNADAGHQKGGGDDLDSKSLDRNFHGANLCSFRLTITAICRAGAMAKRPGICIKFKASKPPSGFGCCRSCLLLLGKS